MKIPAGGGLRHGSLSRRQFAREFKAGHPSGGWERELHSPKWARAFEVDSNVLLCWRREFRRAALAMRFPGLGKRQWQKGRVVQLKRKIGQKAWRLIFFEGMLATHRGAAVACWP